MQVKRKISKEKYVAAVIITAIVFILGLTLGILFDNYRIKGAEEEIKQREIDYLSLQLQYLYLTTLKDNNSSCYALSAAMQKSIKDISESLEKFNTYKDKTRINYDEYNLISRIYIIDNIRYWLFSKKMKEECDMNVVNVVYFYSEKTCIECSDQGVVLTYFKKLFGDKLLVFPINIDYEGDEPMITVLKGQYNVREYPTLIIEDKKYEGILKSEELKEIICKSFKHEIEICQ
jgi:hypothetical protein